MWISLPIQTFFPTLIKTFSRTHTTNAEDHLAVASNIWHLLVPNIHHILVLKIEQSVKEINKASLAWTFAKPLDSSIWLNSICCWKLQTLGKFTSKTLPITVRSIVFFFLNKSPLSRWASFPPGYFFHLELQTSNNQRLANAGEDFFFGPFEDWSPGQTESQVDGSWKLGSTCDSVWPGLALTCLGQTVKNLLWLTCKFDLDQSEHMSSQVNASARKVWPNGVTSRPKFSTCIYLRLRLARALVLKWAKKILTRIC